jgi:ABC-2 type transport system permease protein
MSPFSAILLAKFRETAHAVAAVRRESKLKVAFVSISVVLLWLAAFALAKGGFGALDRLGAALLGTGELSLVELLIPRVLSVLALLLLVLLVFSNALLTHATLFHSPEVALLLASPLPFRTLFVERFAEIVTFSSWSTAYLGSPVVLALGVQQRAPWPFYVGAVVLFVPFVVIPAAVGALLTLAVVRFVPRVPRMALAVLAAGVIAVVFITFRAQVANPQFRESADLSAALRLTAAADSPWLPSFWLADGLEAGARGAAGRLAYDALLLLANALFLTWLAAEVAHRVYHAGWSNLAGVSRASRRRDRAAHREVLTRVLAPLPPAVRALSVKDVRVFARDPAQWSQFAIFFGMLLLYVASMRAGTHGFPTAFWQSWIILLNTVAGLLVLATLTTRFVFPLISLEGRRFWMLSQAPLPRRRLVMQKFGLAVTFSAAITVSLAALTGWRLGLGALPFAFSLLTVVAASFALCGLAVGLGSLYPNLSEESPARIVSGLGGTLTFILSALYIALVAGAQTVVVSWRSFGHHLGGERSLPLVVVAAVTFTLTITAVATLVPLRLGIRNLERLEV